MPDFRNAIRDHYIREAGAACECPRPNACHRVWYDDFLDICSNYTVEYLVNFSYVIFRSIRLEYMAITFVTYYEPIIPWFSNRSQDIQRIIDIKLDFQFFVRHKTIISKIWKEVNSNTSDDRFIFDSPRIVHHSFDFIQCLASEDDL